MESAAKQVTAVVIITVIVGVGLLVYFNQKTPEAQVVSEIDNIGHRIDAVGDSYLNVSLQFSITVENYGRLKEMVIPCTEVQSFLQVKNSTVPLERLDDTVDPNTSYYLESEFFTDTCDDQASTHLVSENVINQLVVAVPFRLLTGTYSFVWFHSFADSFLAASVIIDVPTATVTPILEGGTE